MVAFVGAVEEISDWNFREQLEVNFFGTANIIRCVLPGMRRRRSGHIINITGLSMFTVFREVIIAGQIGTPSLSLLSAAHHAVEGYSEVVHHTVIFDNRHWHMKYYHSMSKYQLWRLRLMLCNSPLKLADIVYYRIK